LSCVWSAFSSISIVVSGMSQADEYSRLKVVGQEQSNAVAETKACVSLEQLQISTTLHEWKQTLDTHQERRKTCLHSANMSNCWY